MSHYACMEKVEYSTCPNGYTVCCLCCSKRNKCKFVCEDIREYKDARECELSRAD